FLIRRSISWRLEDREAKSSEQDLSRLEHFSHVGSHPLRNVRLTASVAVVKFVSAGLTGLLNCEPLQELSMRLREAACARDDGDTDVPEVFRPVVMLQSHAAILGLTDVREWQ